MKRPLYRSRNEKKMTIDIASTPARCLQLTKFYPPVAGGMETTVRDIAEGLTAEQWKVEVLCANTEAATVSEAGNIPVTRVGAFAEVASTSLTPGLFSQLRRLQRRQDIIHVHLPNPMANLALLLARPSAKIAVHWHSDIVKQKRLLALYAPLQSWLLKRADVIFATSPPYAESSPWLQPHMDKVRFVPSCIRDPDVSVDTVARNRLAAEIRARYPSKKIVFALGRMTYYKGFDVLVDAAKYLDDNTVILLGGKGELLEELKQRANDSGVNEKIIFLGRVLDDELPGYYDAAHVFCLPSLMRSEAFGLVMVEAMSYRRPVVATRIPGSGVTWVNVHGETGLNAIPGDPQDLARTIKEVLDNPERAKALGEAGRRRFERHFTIDKMIDAITRSFAEIGVGSGPRG
jgi:glycosyltransferase involved in cell wall biosynthesis